MASFGLYPSVFSYQDALKVFEYVDVCSVLADEQFDRVVSLCVMEHIPDYEKVMREVLRPPKPGGRFVLTVDSMATIRDPLLLERHRRKSSVVEYFTRDRRASALERSGLRLQSVKPILKSDFATALLQRSVTRNKSGRVRCVLDYYRLRCEERRFDERKNGLFLRAVCSK